MAKKDKPKKKKEETPEFVETMELKHTFSPDERLTILDDMTCVTREVKSLEEQSKVSAQGWKQKIKGAKLRLDELNDKATNGFEMRKTSVKLRMDRKKGTKQIFDRETGKLIDTQKMTEDDYQRLPMDTPTAPKIVPLPAEAGKANVGEALEAAQAEKGGETENESSSE